MVEGAGLTLRVPGDKSVSQRALILAAMANGESRIRGILRGADPAATGRALRALGAEISSLAPPLSGVVRVRGSGLRSWQEPTGPLDLENSGTGARLLAGALAAQPMEAVITGDPSLLRRPMERIAIPLRQMGASVTYLGRSGVLPIRITGGALSPLSYESPVSSAQVKSAILLAGVGSGVEVKVQEPRASRDHTERMLASMGVEVESEARGAARVVRLVSPPERLAPLDVEVPGDFSSAAFFLAWAVLSGKRSLVVRSVGLNETRTGFLKVLSRMGVALGISPKAGGGGEPVGSVRVGGQGGGLRAVEVGEAEVPGMIDEIPILATLAARAQGVTKITGAGELKVKESNRLRALASNLREIGVQVEETSDGLEVEGTRRPLHGRVPCFGDHRIAMAFGVLGATPGCDIEVDDPTVVDVSFPGFWELLARVCRPGAPAGEGMKAKAPPRFPASSPNSRAQPPCLVVAIDGPAGSGKSTTAKALADRLGFRHLDSGAVYRGVALGILESGRDPEDSAGISPLELADLGVQVRWRDRTPEIRLGGTSVPDSALRTGRVTSLASRISGMPAVRAHLLELQRAGARGPGLVAEGRDMGTVVFPTAPVKVFLTANVRERARRRLRQAGVANPAASRIEREVALLAERDRRDSERKLAPLKPAPDAICLDTTDMKPEDQIDRIVALVEKARRFGLK